MPALGSIVPGRWGDWTWGVGTSIAPLGVVSVILGEQVCDCSPLMIPNVVDERINLLMGTHLGSPGENRHKTNKS